ncbi:MAG: class II aldolase/adducin family protein [Bacillota bacterium]
MNLLAEKARERVARSGIKMAQAGLVVGTWGNVSCRVSREDLVVITPSGMAYDSLQPQDIVVVNLDGEIVEGERRPSTELELHLAIYRARPDVQAVMHTHSVFASAMAVARQPIPPVVEDVAQIVGGQVPVAEYAPPGSRQLARNVVSALGQGNAVLLCNHGVVGVGGSLDEAFVVCQIVEKAAQVYLWAGLAGTPAVLSEKEVADLRRDYLTFYGQNKGGGGRK